MPIHKIKQKKQWRKVYNYTAATTANWNDFLNKLETKTKILRETPWENINLPRK